MVTSIWKIIRLSNNMAKYHTKLQVNFKLADYQLGMVKVVRNLFTVFYYENGIRVLSQLFNKQVCIKTRFSHFRTRSHSTTDNRSLPPTHAQSLWRNWIGCAASDSKVLDILLNKSVRYCLSLVTYYYYLHARWNSFVRHSNGDPTVSRNFFFIKNMGKNIWTFRAASHHQIH